MTRLTYPFRERDVRKLRAGEAVSVSGLVFTGRDRFMPFLLDEFNRLFKGEKMLSGISKARFGTMTHERMGR